jgi:hypothetical protein
MRIGKYEVFKTLSFIAPKGDNTVFDVGPEGTFKGQFKAIVDWHTDDPLSEVPKDKVGTRWRTTNEDGKTTVRITFVNLQAPFGGSMNQFSEFGKIGGVPFGFMVFFQTYAEEAASFTLQFMMEVQDV